MTITECLRAVERRYEHGTDYYDSSTEDFMLRLGLANDKINMWENESGMLWRELYSSATVTLDANGEAEIIDLHMPAGKVSLNGKLYPYMGPELIQEATYHTPSRELYTILNGDGHRTVKVHPNPGAAEITLPYYKNAHTYIDGDDTTAIEMADPYFIVHMVCSDLFMDDGDQDRASIEIQIGSEKLASMRMRNETAPPHTDEYADDYDFIGLGK